MATEAEENKIKQKGMQEGDRSSLQLVAEEQQLQEMWNYAFSYLRAEFQK